MKTLSVKVPDGLDARLAALARQQGASKSEIVRKALEGLLARNGRPRRGSALDLAGDLVGRVAGPGDLSFRKAHLRHFGR